MPIEESYPRKFKFYCESCHAETFMYEGAFGYQVAQMEDLLKMDYAYNYHIVYNHIIPYLIDKISRTESLPIKQKVYDSIIEQPIPLACEQLRNFIEYSGWSSDYENYCIARKLNEVNENE